MVLAHWGGPHAFEELDVERPTPGVGEVLVRIVASGTNPVDAKLRQDGSWAGLKLPVILGYDVAGVVEQLGAGVTEFATGDDVYFTPEIFGNQHGSYAEYTVAPVTIVAKKPTTLSYVEAAAVPLAGGTAWDALVRRMKVAVGETLLVHGGAGGVGSYAVQLGKALGAYVLATAGADNQATLKELGADVAIDYRRDDLAAVVMRETGGAGVDAVFSTSGGEQIIESLMITRPFGRLATILPVQGDLSAVYMRNQTLHGVFLTRERQRLDEMTRLFERKQLRSLIGDVLPLNQVGKAHERLDSGHGRGKIVLEIAR
ncbi:MAG: zinc-dependent alcohol dehydrogenase family protein [Herpetosiphon sp.]